MSTDDQDPRSRPMARLFGIATRRSDVSTDGQSLFDTLVARAAVVGTFTPRGLTVGLETEESVNDALQQVLDKSAVVTVDRQRRWMLEPTMRSTTFARRTRQSRRCRSSGPDEDGPNSPTRNENKAPSERSK